MLNPYVVKKYLAFLVLGTLPMCAIVFGIAQYGLLNGIMIGSGVLIVASLLANYLLDNNFRSMLEGKGILTILWDSTGVIDFHILGVSNGRITGNIAGKRINEPYDQNLIHTLPSPKVHEEGYELQESKDAEGKLTGEGQNLILDMRKFRAFRFGFQQYPVLVYNRVTKTLMTKEALGNMERSMASHLVYVASERAKDLNASMLAFSRVVVDKEHNTDSTTGLTILKWVIIGLVVLFVGWFIYKMITNGGGSAVGNAVSVAKGTISNTVVTPR